MSTSRILSALLSGFMTVGLVTPALADQTFTLKGDAGGKRFDGIGAVSGGGATSVLLKDYPEAQRNQVLDLLFKPKFGASMSVLLVEVPGDGNATQGSESSHMHTRDDLNYSRGYEWWLMREAKQRNADVALDACAWGCPAWVGQRPDGTGNGNFWSQDMADYYTKWIQGLKSVYGLQLDAIGCRNEKGVNENFAKIFRKTLDANGLQNVLIHGFDNWDRTKFDWVRHMTNDMDLRKAVAILSNHTMATAPTPPDIRELADTYDKPIWNTEEHVYKKGFDCEISLVQAYNQNFLVSGVTRIVNWYLVGSVYPVESYAEDPAVLLANTPWSGNYKLREVMWGYAHYGQFTKIGWQYLNGGCGKLDGGGTLVTLKSPDNDYSIIAETKDANDPQTVTFQVGGGLSGHALCVWRSDANEQFVRQPDLQPAGGAFSVTLEPKAVYSISTTTGQQKGSFADVPPAKAFPFPYYETFDEYTTPQQWGYLPHYTADIASVFEIADRPDGPGKCLRQVTPLPPQSWAPEWMPYTILGDPNWGNYEVSADIYLTNGWAGVMGRVNNVGTGYGTVPKGYYLRLGVDGQCGLYVSTQARNNNGPGQELATGTAPNVAAGQWHNLKLQMDGDVLTGLVDGTPVLTATNNVYPRGVAGLITGDTRARYMAYFDNLLINKVGAPKPQPTEFAPDQRSMY